MFKATPNPSATSCAVSIDPWVVDEASSHYKTGPNAASKPASFTAPGDHRPEPRNTEDALVDVSSILQSAAATAYEHANNQSVSNRKMVMSVVYLIELAQLRVNSVLDA
ncbi:hypothetical protein HX866_30400 [Pseudomonas gingeri]|uniref:DUF6124 family protein n=1 Tax=Pseudomonas gingeri TaxID=117681 RepID=UPI0015A30E87|nr:hypothetical protein [Pseudomonas gingeri]NWA29206.1 hypothetical protein [Pseudomonas gingeri]